MSNRYIATGKRKGSIFVDAALCIPVFVLAAAMLLMMIGQVRAEENASHGMAVSSLECVDVLVLKDRDDSLFAAANLSWRAAWQVFLQGRGQGLGECSGIPRIYTGIDLPLSEEIGSDGVIAARVAIKAGYGKAEGLFGSSLEGCRTMVFRPFIGESSPKEFESEDETVYIFPKRGTRYHHEGCRIMQDGCVETVLTKSLKKKARACKICKPDDDAYGNTVYMYLDSSGVYHRKSCACITKCYEGISESEAIAEGYTPCSYCGGK